MTEKPKPIIGISWGEATITGSLCAVVTQIRSAGGNPLVIKDFRSHSHICSEIDGLVLMGNDLDVNPATYGQTPHIETKVETDVVRAEFEERAVRVALERGLPLLGICGGLQRLNTVDHAVCKGTLHQHVPDVTGHEQHRQTAAPYEATQKIRIVEGSLLFEISQEKEFMENSFHHQAVDRVRCDFHASAFADDGLIEAIEPARDGRYAGRFILGVQWHPEFGASYVGARMMNRLVMEAALFSKPG